MPYYAQIQAGRVGAVSELSEVFDPARPDMVVIEQLDEGLLGQLYDAETGQFSPAPPALLPRHITQLAFLGRFTDGEAIAIDLASIGATPQAAAMRRYLNKVNAARYIDLDREDTRAGVETLEAAGLLASGRAAQILDAEIQPQERP